MDRLWAPWRIKYVSGKNKACIFCRALKSRRDKANFVLERGEHAFSLLNLFPYNNGHAMVAPNRHVSSLEKLDDKELLALLKLVNRTQRDLTKCLRPDGFNIGMNIGRTAGAGFPGHVHIHIVPRWNGDTNFMPVVGKTKVISQSLEELYQRLKRC
jgi:ATP adenylyltransferase